MAPVLLIAVFYPQGGAFPFRWPALLLTLVVAWPGPRLRAGRAAARAASRPCCTRSPPSSRSSCPTPLGANLTRFGMYAAGPTLLAARAAARGCWPLRDPAAAVLAVVAGARRDRSGPADDPSTRAGLLPAAASATSPSVGAETGRVEIVPTARHWEAALRRRPLPDRPGVGAPTRHPLQPALLRGRTDRRGVPRLAARVRASTASPSPTRRSTIRRSRRRR